ncbi:hypothetical protein HYE59_02590 [Aggregatibacter actinomycetemcomitans]|uniref:hypothetical protein n=1 Tax=Aggregatibacter actinomycetemcomitans TaxID=714 RepID=UPI00197B5B1A|nr:hypothetical protein [Aggregatibacter actinomycetemcomitans]MBN6076448.1 hypothetical protein [Aggregatibacter actinomycetemcomitans]
MNNEQIDNILPVSYLMEEYEKRFNKKLDLEKLLLLFYENYDVALFIHFSFSNDLLSMAKGIEPIHKDNFDFYLSFCDISREFGFLYPEESMDYKNADIEYRNKICNIDGFSLEGVIKFSFYDNYFTPMKSENYVLREITKFSGYFNFRGNKKTGLKLNKENLTLSNFHNNFRMNYDLLDCKFCSDNCVNEYYISKMEVTFNNDVLNDFTLDFANDIYIQKEKIEFILRNIDNYNPKQKKEKKEKVQEQEVIYKEYFKIKEENKKLKRENKKLLQYENIINGLIHMHNPKFYKPNQQGLFNGKGEISINAVSNTVHRITNKLIESGYLETEERSVSTITNTLNEFVYKLPK